MPINEHEETNTTNDDWITFDPLGLDVLEDDANLVEATQSDTHEALIGYTNRQDNSNKYLTSIPNVPINNNLSGNNRDDSNPHKHSHKQTMHKQTNSQTQTTNIMINNNITNNLSSNQHADQPANQLNGQQHEEPEVKFDGDTSRANPHFKPLLPDPIHKNEPGRQLIMDTETTGLDALKGDRIIEVGIVELVDRKFTGEKLHVYINPKRGMDEDAIRIHGISKAFLEDKPTFDKVAKSLYDFMLGSEVIAHNANFDITFLSMEFDKVGLTDFADNIKVTDSIAIAKQKFPGQKNSLDALVRRLEVGNRDRTFHGALLDAEILAEVYLAMTGGQVSLAIDEDVEVEGGGAHTDYSQLANLLVSAKSEINEHLNWVASLVDKHPELTSSQGISCLYQLPITDTNKSKIYLKPTLTRQINLDTINLTHNLYLASSL